MKLLLAAHRCADDIDTRAAVDAVALALKPFKASAEVRGTAVALDLSDASWRRLTHAASALRYLGLTGPADDIEDDADGLEGAEDETVEAAEEIVRVVLAAVAEALPCTFPKGFVEDHEMNSPVAPEAVLPGVVDCVVGVLVARQESRDEEPEAAG